MPQRTASARWQGSLQDGKGTMRLGSGAYEGQYSFASRFEDGTGTNPEELLGAAHAGCFSMALSSALSKAGHVPDEVSTTATVHLEKVGDGFTITRIDLGLRRPRSWCRRVDVPRARRRREEELSRVARARCH